MHRQIAVLMFSRQSVPATVSGLPPQFGIRCFSESPSVFAPSMHGPGGQPSGTPVLNKTVKKQPSRDDAPSKGHQVVKDEPASQGSNADSTTSGSSSKGNSPQDATRVTDAAGRKGIHTLRSSTVLNTTISRGFFKMQSVKQAYNDKSGDFALADRHDPSRDTAAAAEAKNANSGVASGSTRKDASDTGHPSESAPTASQAVNENVKDQGLHGAVKTTQGNLQITKDQQVDKDTLGCSRTFYTSGGV